MPEPLEEAKRLSEAASPGPWHVGDAGGDRRRVFWYENGGLCTIAEVCTWEGPDADAEFIARARTLIPELVDLIESERRVRAAS